MDDKRKTIAAITIVVGVVALVLIVVGILVSGNKTISPVPDEGAIKIIFVSPTPVVMATPSATIAPTKHISPTKKPTPKPTTTPTKSASASAVPAQ